MKIKSVSVSRPNLELTRPYTIAYKSVTSVENCIVELTTDTGLCGLGAANPSPYVVGESLDDTWQMLQSADWLTGQDIRHLGVLCSTIQSRYPRHPGVRTALETALYDLFTQYLNTPLSLFLGQCISSLPTSITIGIKGVAETLAEAEEYLGRGFRILKVKLGCSLEEDLERLMRIREKFGYQIGLRIDANQGYDTPQLLQFYEKTRLLGIELNEQPLPAQAVSELKALPEPIRKTIAADESLCTPTDAFILAQHPAACGIFNIKLMKCGGITSALEIACVARQAGIELMWGCNDESIISITAALHVALACPHTRYLDLDGSLDLARDVVSGGFVLTDGLLSIRNLPGLGLQKLPH